MKRKHFFSFAVAFVLSIMAIPAISQTAKDVFNTQTPIFYFGIDFTKAKLINDAEANENDIKDRQFDGINDLMVNEAKKYDFAGALRRSELPNDLGFVAKRNATIDPDNIKSTSSADYNRLKESDIQEVVKAFDFGNNKGIGLLIVMEGMSKSKKGASMWITFVDISAKKVLFTERMEGKGGMAFGFRNYWAVPIRDVVDEIKKKKYSEWKSKYGG
jgi:hypothetical protein